jgi:hypothetical protein
MGMSAAKVLLISLFLIAGMLLPGIVWQPKGSFEVWNIIENDFPRNGSSEEKMTFLLNYAILAPSIYNTQPWRFNVSDGSIMVMADESRWLQAADGDKREMHISIGNALENLIIAADHFGYNHTVSYVPGGESIIARVSLQPSAQAPMDPQLFSAITSLEKSSPSKTNEVLREQDSVPQTADLANIESISTDQDIRVFLTDDPDIKSRFLNLTLNADQVLYSDIEFKSELGLWLSRGAMGPTGVQAKIDQIKVAFLDRVPDQIEKDSEIVNSSLYLGFITSQKNDAESQVRAGQLFERIRLLSSSANLSLQPMNQALQAVETESEVNGLLGEKSEALNGSFVQQIFCLDVVGPANELTPRRPLEEVLI